MICKYFSNLLFKENVSSLKSSLNSSIASLHQSVEEMSKNNSKQVLKENKRYFFPAYVQ